MPAPATVPRIPEAEEGWIALSSIHLVPWALLAAGFLNAAISAILPFGFQGRALVGWGFTLINWALGILALTAAFQARADRPPRTLRLAALGLATAALALRICTGLALPLTSRLGGDAYVVWTVSHLICALLGLGALVLLLAGREEDAGGRFDGAVAALALAGGAGWLGLLVLAIAAMGRHPLLAVQWQALREPGTALAGGWFDGQDEERRQGHLGACALALALAFLALAGRLALASSHGHQPGATVGWALADLAATLLAGLLLGIHGVRNARRTGHRAGRRMALAAILVASVPLLLLLAAAVFLALILTDVIPFRLF